MLNKWLSARLYSHFFLFTFLFFSYFLNKPLRGPNLTCQLPGALFFLTDYIFTGKALELNGRKRNTQLKKAFGKLYKIIDTD